VQVKPTCKVGDGDVIYINNSYFEAGQANLEEGPGISFCNIYIHGTFRAGQATLDVGARDFNFYYLIKWHFRAGQPT
jgi:hypothetical protein